MRATESSSLLAKRPLELSSQPRDDIVAVTVDALREGDRGAFHTTAGDLSVRRCTSERRRRRKIQSIASARRPTAESFPLFVSNFARADASQTQYTPCIAW